MGRPRAGPTFLAPGFRRIDVLLPPELGLAFDAAVKRRAGYQFKRVSWAVRDAISDWVNKPDIIPLTDTPEVLGQLALFDELSRTEDLAEHIDQADAQE